MNWLQFLLLMGQNKINFGRDSSGYNRIKVRGAIEFVQSLPQDLIDQIIGRVDMQDVLNKFNEDVTADNISIREDV